MAKRVHITQSEILFYFWEMFGLLTCSYLLKYLFKFSETVLRTHDLQFDYDHRKAFSIDRRSSINHTQYVSLLYTGFILNNSHDFLSTQLECFHYAGATESV